MSASRVLIVDGEESLAKLIANTLAEAGHEVTRVASGAEALAVLGSSGEYDLMLSELAMPGMDGVALLQHCKERYPDMPVILCAGTNDASVALDAIRRGAYDYLLRPFEDEQLLAITGRALEYRRLKLDNRVYQSNLESLVAARTQQLHDAMIDLERSYDTTIEIAADLQGLKDSATGVHARRVTAFTIALGRALGLDGEKIRVVARAAILHDIGMIAVPDAIIRKPGPLSPEEDRIQREHCFRGYQVLKKIPFLTEAAELVYAHEERYDGTGFPRGLKGEAIPQGARIFSVAHAFDAILTERPYRAAKGLAEARVEIAQLAGKQFDPAVVRVFLDMPDKVWMELRSEVDKQAVPSS
ncbi:MAG: response regulator [Acidobacteriia bacterium]|nr:response regulator [Terriglobia bacterium]